MIKIGILGANGRMGQMIAKEIAGGGYDAKLAASVGRDGDKNKAFETCDALIDFTEPDALMNHAALAHQHKKALIVGTTGLAEEHMAALRVAAHTAPVLQSANTSLGVNVLLALVEQLAAKLNDEYDIEIFEKHHRRKVDAPSGTALALANAAAKGRGVNLNDALVPARYGQVGARAAGQIGISVFRGGDVIGDHTVTFAAMDEQIELTHKANDRGLFAKGAVKAALWLAGKPPGLYTMRDVLGL